MHNTTKLIIVCCLFILGVVGVKNLGAFDPPAPIVAGELTADNVCSTVGLLIRQKFGSNIKTAQARCHVTKLDPFDFKIESGYQSPLKQAEIRYIGLGSIYKNTVILSEIKVLGVDQDFVPFPNL